MINVQDFIRNSDLFKKFVVDELLFVEIICPVEDETAKNNLWWHHNFFAYAMAGEMLLKTLTKEHIFRAGECIFAKKGSIIAAHHLVKEDFCELRVFVPDDFIRSVVQKYKIAPTPSESTEISDALIRLDSDDALDVYFHSLLTYFAQPKPPAKTLLRLKFEELLVHLLFQKGHDPIKGYFHEICSNSKPSIKDILEANFPHNLSLDEFARLCGRSLSAFKEEFKNIFHTTPGKWLLKKRLEYSRYLLETTNDHVAQICYESGFENLSHFHRVFKNRYGLPPGRFRMQKNV